MILGHIALTFKKGFLNGHQFVQITQIESAVCSSIVERKKNAILTRPNDGINALANLHQVLQRRPKKSWRCLFNFVSVMCAVECSLLISLPISDKSSIEDAPKKV